MPYSKATSDVPFLPKACSPVLNSTTAVTPVLQLMIAPSPSGNDDHLSPGFGVENNLMVRP